MSTQEHEAKFTADTKDFEKGADKVADKANSLGNRLKVIGGMFAAAFSVAAIINFGKEIIGLASKVEGVETAFNRIASPDLLSDLRDATRGTVTDLELMQKAVQAKNFKIPLTNLATYFEFATKRAIQTGESVDSLVNSIITGIGRKSAPVMDNLGISSAELQEEIKKTGDFAIASGNIIRRELNSMGEVTDTTATKMVSFNTQMTNLKTNLGKVVTESKLFNDALNDINRTVSEMVDSQEDQNVIQESSLSKWDKLIFRLAKFTKLGRESIDVMAEGIKKQGEQNDTADAGIRVEEVHAKTIADYRLEIEGLTSSLETLTAGEGKRAEAIRNQITELQKLIDATINYRTVSKDTPFTAETRQIQMPEIMPEGANDELAKAPAQIEAVAKELTRAELSAMAFGDAIMQAGIDGQGSMADFGRTALNIAKKVIAAYLAEGIAAAVKSALTGIPFPFNLIAAGVAGGTAAALFSSLVPDFAAGGAVSGPTMALVGEAPGISASNPEYIGTAKQLAQMGIGGGNLTCRVSRGDLLFILNEGKSVNTGSY